MIVAIMVVAIAILAVTESKMKQTYEQRFANYFGNQVAQIEKSSSTRSQEFIQLCQKLAATDYVVNTLRKMSADEDTSEFWKFYIESTRDLEGKQGPGPQGKGSRALLSGDALNKVGNVAAMGLDGHVITVPLPQQAGNRRGGQKRMQMRRTITELELAEFARSNIQRTIYLPFVSGDGSEFVQEMVSTPVVDPETGEPLGLFLRSTPAETDAQRLLERYYEEFHSESAPLSGILLEGQVFSRTLDPVFAAALSDSIGEEFGIEPGILTASDFDTEIDGIPYRVYVAPLTKDTVFRRAFQVTTFPLARLHDDLAELRILGSGIGTFGLLLGFLVASLFSRRLSVPLRALAEGTGEIQKGNLDHRVEVKSRDEIGELADSFNDMTGELKQKAVYRELLGKVSDETVAQALISGSLDLELGGELKNVSILFCDIRNFTQMTEQMNPCDVIDMLNDHMTAMTGIVRKNFGVVDKFIGDEVMAVFGGLKSYDCDAANAVTCALEMIAAREQLNSELEHPIEIGIGIASGEVVAGCMGSTDRLNYTVLGARVNLAARLCGTASIMETVADNATVESCRIPIITEPLPELSLKGVSVKEPAFRLIKLGKRDDQAPATKTDLEKV